MRIDSFYAAPERKASEEVRLGSEWTSASDPDGTYSLFWVEATREVCALRSGAVVIGPGAPKPYGVYLPRVRNEGSEDREVTILGTADLDEVKAMIALAGPSQRTLEWLRERL